MDVLSTVNIAKPGINSLRTTIPQSIVAYLNLEPGNKLKWDMTLRENNRAVIVLQVVDNSPAKPTKKKKAKKKSVRK